MGSPTVPLSKSCDDSAAATRQAHVHHSYSLVDWQTLVLEHLRHFVGCLMTGNRRSDTLVRSPKLCHCCVSFFLLVLERYTNLQDKELVLKEVARWMSFFRFAAAVGLDANFVRGKRRKSVHCHSKETSMVDNNSGTSTSCDHDVARDSGRRFEVAVNMLHKVDRWGPVRLPVDRHIPQFRQSMVRCNSSRERRHIFVSLDPSEPSYRSHFASNRQAHPLAVAQQ
mmetsp:Transcript_15187/g.33232  ORF Transcript_15187/g.33232 Transcript_15187/m.33232 type:complete len:225 (-) Transcript_15187:393-1067(-)